MDTFSSSPLACLSRIVYRLLSCRLDQVRSSPKVLDRCREKTIVGEKPCIPKTKR